MTDKIREQRARRVALRQDLTLKKSRARITHLDDHGGYMLIKNRNNSVAAGPKFELDLDAVEARLGIRS